MKSHTNLPQSKKLAEILPLESGDMHYVLIDTDEDKYAAGLGKYIGILPHYPCWSFTALFGALPNFIGDYSKCLYYDVGGYYCGYMVDGDFMLMIEETKADNPVDACVAMIEKLHELKML